MWRNITQFQLLVQNLCKLYFRYYKEQEKFVIGEETPPTNINLITSSIRITPHHTFPAFLLFFLYHCFLGLIQMEDFNAILTYERNLGYASKSPSHEPSHIGPSHARPPRLTCSLALGMRFLVPLRLNFLEYMNRNEILFCIGIRNVFVFHRIRFSRSSWTLC